jgi:hypothetical protein
MGGEQGYAAFRLRPASTAVSCLISIKDIHRESIEHGESDQTSDSPGPRTAARVEQRVVAE